MHAITTRWGKLQLLDRRTGRLRRLLSALATAAVERLTSPQRDVPPESYRFPPF